MKSILPLKYLVLIAVLIFGAWFHFELAAIILIAYIIAALLFHFESKTSLVAGIFLLTARFILPHIHPDLIKNVNVQSLQIYGMILIVFWLAAIVDKRVNIFIVGEEGKLKEPKKIIIESSLDSAIIKRSAMAIFAFIGRGFEKVFKEVGYFSQKSIKAVKEAPNLPAQIWISIKYLINLFYLVFKRIFHLIAAGIKGIGRTVFLAVKKTIRFII
ncbi:MAG: hypothetical protein J7M38_01315, partial [Armatimonadetes bacterium]|nr:hypothetical protein [Armatimonadota bacterium]